MAIVATVGSTAYSVRHFAINTDINKLISPELDWRKREADFEKAFPGHFGSTLVVVEAPTAEYASLASVELAKRLTAQPNLFRSVENMSGDEFFARNALLFQPTNDIEHMTQGLGQAAPLISTLVGDPSLRGLT
ncbi:MAG: MMPL family transporter, partial [Terriglobia bacterium]